MKELNNLTESEYLLGANLALENAKSHIQVAKDAANNNQFGISISHLIIALEELAKASALKLKSINNKIEIQNLKDYFMKHTTKHDIIFKFYSAALIYIKDEVDLTLNKNENSNNFTDLQLTLLVVLLILFVKFENKDENTSKEYSLDYYRNSGFYLNFNNKTREWELPNNKFDNNDFITFHDNIIEIISVIENSLFENKITNDNLIEFSAIINDEKIITTQLEEIYNKMNSEST